MSVAEYHKLCARVLRVSNLINFLGRVLGRYTGSTLAFLIIEGNAARGIADCDPDFDLARAFLKDYRQARKRILKWLGGAFIFALGAGAMAVSAPQFSSQSARGFVDGSLPR